MELRFLGQTYSTSNYRVSTVAIPSLANFRGQSYIRRRSVSNFKPQLGLRKYRGVTYGTQEVTN